MMTRDGGNRSLLLLSFTQSLTTFFSSYSFQLVIAIPKWFKPARSKWASSRPTIASCTMNSSSALKTSSRECLATRFRFAISWTAEARRTIWHCDWLVLIRSRRTSSHSTSEYRVVFLEELILSHRRRLAPTLICLVSNHLTAKRGEKVHKLSYLWRTHTSRLPSAISRAISNFKANQYSRLNESSFMSFHLRFWRSAIRRDSLISCWWESAINSRTRRAGRQLCW